MLVRGIETAVMLMDPEPHGLILQGSSFQIEFRRDGARLRAFVTGIAGSLAQVNEYWHLIAAETVRSGVSRLLVVDHTRGDALDPEDLALFICGLDGLGLEKVRCAYVGSDPNRTAQNEATEILAREHGFIARVFGIEAEASIWLRHGAS